MMNTPIAAASAVRWRLRMPSGLKSKTPVRMSSCFTGISGPTALERNITSRHGKPAFIFIRYEREAPPVVSEDNGLTVTVNSPDFPEAIEIEADSVVLSTGLEAAKDNRRLADMLKVPLNADGFFVEAHLKLRPVDFATEGIFLCGLAHSPKMMDENISQAHAAAARAATVLSKTHLEVGAQVSSVDQDKCISCLTCIRACPYGAPVVNVDRKAEIVAAKCMGCGICAAECPAHAIQLNHFETKQFSSMLDELFQVQKDENIKAASVPR